jgi:FeS assembly SUF system regulator
MLRISKLTDYATVLLASLASEPDRLHAATELAERTRIASPTVSKLLKQLQRAGLVASSRGLHGGYRLARPAVEISAAAILEALEGPPRLTDCASTDHARCELETTCRVGNAWQRLNRAIHQSLHDITLAELAGLETTTTRYATFEVRLRNGLNAGLRKS